MKTSAFTGGNWLKCEDLVDSAVVKINDATREEVTSDEGKTEKKLAIHFAGGDFAPMLLNKTNARFLEKLLGTDTDEWIGQKVTLYVDAQIMFGSKKVSGLRIAAAGQKELDANAPF